MKDARFITTKVTSCSHELIQAVEVAALGLGTASETAAVHAAFSRLSLAREALYRRIEMLEMKDSREIRDVHLRF